MSTIEQNLIGKTAGLSRVDKVLRYFFFALLIGTVIYSIGGTFFGKDNRLPDYGLADAALLLASLSPGYSRPIPGAHRAFRACHGPRRPPGSLQHAAERCHGRCACRLLLLYDSPRLQGAGAPPRASSPRPLDTQTGTHGKSPR